MRIKATITIPLSEHNQLKEDNLLLNKQIAVLNKQVSELENSGSELMKIIEALKEEIRLLKNGKNSGTSHTPPSHQIGRSNAKSLREKTDRKTGGQPGHEGTTLQMKEVPDETIDYTPQYCNDCGEDLQHAVSVLSAKRQELVIPLIQVRYVEHRCHSKVCTRCGKLCTAAMPPYLTAPVQYGPSVGAMVSYLSVYQYIPYHRMSVLLKDLFGLPISEGSIDNLLERTAQKALPLYNIIQQKIQQSEVVGSDETGASFGGKKGWFHTWQTTCLTFIVASFNRGYETIEKYFANGFPFSVYVSDCWAAQLKVAAFLHQLCTAHLLRELRNFEDALACKWSIAMKQLLQDAIALKKQLTPQDYLQTPAAVIQIEERLTELLLYDHSASHKKLRAFSKRLIKNKDSILTFLYHPKVPPDNNASERAIRNVKVKAKVSGQFRSEAGARRFAILRSVIDTTIKNTQNVFEALTFLTNLELE
ncbi:MAG: IS66 family transposase [Bacteroidota bacterium]|nr:IS66 family transposase [Bacteroidota bacterium]